MSAPKVDVLAELDALIIIRASRAAQDNAPLTAVGDLQRAEATRAAVAELIDACGAAASDEGMDQDELDRLRTALARIGSAA